MNKSKKRLVTLLVILGYLALVNFYPFPKNPLGIIQEIAIDIVKLIFLITSIIIIVHVWRKKKVNNTNNT